MADSRTKYTGKECGPHRALPGTPMVDRAIEAALTETDGKLYGPGGAAERLGLNPGTLQSKMRKLGIDRRAFVPGPARE